MEVKLNFFLILQHVGRAEAVCGENNAIHSAETILQVSAPGTAGNYLCSHQAPKKHWAPGVLIDTSINTYLWLL